MRRERPGIALGIATAVLFWGMAAHGAATRNVFPKGVAALYNAATGAAIVASVTPGTTLAVSGEPSGSASREQVSVQGWSPEGGESIIFQAPDLRVILARVEGSGVAERKVLGKKTDAYGTTWQHVTLSAWVEKSDVMDNVSAVWAPAQKLYEARCSSCHALHKPAEFTANQWPGVLTTMAKNAALDPAQTALVTRYLQAHARAQ